MAALTLVIGNYNLSSWSLRPWLLMKQFGIAFDTVRVELEVPGEKPPHVKAAILAQSPSGRVPALKHRGLTIWDSLAIAEYLNELYPDRHMWPADTDARALARAVSAEMHSGFMDMRTTMSMNFIGSTPIADLPRAVASDVQRVEEIWSHCRGGFASDGPFLFGRFSIADAMYAPVVSRFTTYGIRANDVSRAYMDTIWALPAMQEWLGEATREVAAA